MNKIKAYLGFAMKGGFAVFGYDNIVEKPKKAKLVILCNTLSENSKNKFNIFIEKHNIKAYYIKDIELSEILDKDKVKAIAVSNIGLANQLEKSFEDSDLFIKI